MALPFYLRRIEKFSERYLSPSERLSEILFGLIMVLTITSTLNIALGESANDVRIMAFGALGCNIAWGIVDGIMYIITRAIERGREGAGQKISKSDIKGAFAAGLLVFAAGLPVVLPFLIGRKLWLAIRISNLVAIGMLFAIGYEIGHYTKGNKLLTGLSMVLLGLVIVGICVALGG